MARFPNLPAACRLQNEKLGAGVGKKSGWWANNKWQSGGKEVIGRGITWPFGPFIGEQLRVRGPLLVDIQSHSVDDGLTEYGGKILHDSFA